MENTTLKAPFGWVGGKSKLAKEIISQIPDNHNIYIEVFGGALNVLYAKQRSKLEVVNDINGELINLHRCIRTNPQTLSMYLNSMLISRMLFEDIKTSKIKPTNHIEAAAFYIYQLTQSFGSKCDNFAMSAKSGRKPKDIYKSYQKWATRLKNVTIENKNFVELIDLYDKNEAFFYCDPPYVNTEKYYKNTGGFNKKEHELLASKLTNIKGRFLLSYNDCDFVRSLYKDFNIKSTTAIEYTLGKNMHNKNKLVSEVLISNY